MYLVSWHYKVEFRHCNKEKHAGKSVYADQVEQVEDCVRDTFVFFITVTEVYLVVPGYQIHLVSVHQYNENKQKSKRKIVEKVKSTPVTQTHDCAHFWLAAFTSIVSE
jgi:Trm5-related predicted tRNA methylase